jgi:hypothetical protein
MRRELHPLLKRTKSNGSSPPTIPRVPRYNVAYLKRRTGIQGPPLLTFELFAKKVVF